jgi:predicted P-loop ATPase/GTPase
LAKIFIFGLFPESSGKTVVATALARGLSNEGKSVGIFKPRSGHNIWYQYNTFLKCKAEGTLYCRDVIKLKNAAKCAQPYEILNPVDALMGPLNVENFLERDLINHMYLLESEVYPQLIAERYTHIEEGKIKNIFLINEQNVNDEIILLDHNFIAKIMDNSAKVILVHDLNEWASAFVTYGPSSIYSCYEVIRQSYENVVIEGFNDAISPEPRVISDTDIIIGVAPGSALLYKSRDFNKVIDVMTQVGKEPTVLRAKEVINFLKCDKVLKIPAIPQNLLTDYDALSEKFEKFINHVISVANV